MGKLSYLKKALDMSKAARMQRAAEQGFDTNTTYYHGSNSDITSPREMFVTKDPDFANQFTMKAPSSGYEGGNVMPLRVGVSKTFDTRRPEHRRIFEKEYYRKYGSGSPLSDDGLPDWTDAEDLAEFLGETGRDFDSIAIQEPAKNISRGPEPEWVSRESLYVLDPSKIRSVNAAFDHANIGNSDLLGKATPGGMATAGGLAAGAEFARRRANKTQTLKGLGEAALTVGSGILGGFVGDLSRLGGYLNPFMSVEDTERGAEALSGSMQYIPSGAATTYLDRVSQGLEQAEKETAWAAGKLGWENSIPNKIYQALPERAQGIIDTTLL